MKEDNRCLPPGPSFQHTRQAAQDGVCEKILDLPGPEVWVIVYQVDLRWKVSSRFCFRAQITYVPTSAPFFFLC